MQHGDRLDGWKAIANFLGRERTTAIRWAKERALPFHRVPGGRTGTVFALRSELDAWLASEPDKTAVDIDRVAEAGPLLPVAPRIRDRFDLASAALTVILVCSVIAVGLTPGARRP
jgi:hypothetical protein